MCRQGTAQNLMCVPSLLNTAGFLHFSVKFTNPYREAVTVIDVPWTPGVLTLPTPRAFKS